MPDAGATEDAGLPIACSGIDYTAPEACTPGWTSLTPLINVEDQGWTDDSHACSPSENAVTDFSSPTVVAGRPARELTWDIGSCAYAQSKYVFEQPVDLSSADLFGIDLHGGGTTEVANVVSLVLADADDVFCGVDLPFEKGGEGVGDETSVNQLVRWQSNLAIPRASFTGCFTTVPDGTDTVIDWSRVNRFFLVVKRPASEDGPGGGSGTLSFGGLRYTQAAAWPRQADFAESGGDRYSCEAQRAIDYVLSQQVQETGLFVSWKEEEEQTGNVPPAVLYDMALVLIGLSREGLWEGAEPANAAAVAADALVQTLVLELERNVNLGRPYWPRRWNAKTGDITEADPWEGDETWMVIAMTIYGETSGNTNLSAAATMAADTVAGWLESKVNGSGELLGADGAPTNTESTVTAWWAMVRTGRSATADSIETHLLGPDRWNSALGYWQRGANDPVVALDAQTWTSSVARHPRVGREDLAKAALSFARRTLVTETEEAGTRLCGLDGMGPVSLWNEGMGQFISAGGEDAPSFLDALIWQQARRPDGSLPGTPGDTTWSSGYGWLTPWSGIAPTIWLYFAITGSPFPE